jgi:hypothetical protein
MRNKELLEVVEGYKITAHNKCYGMGQYYSEDDWNISVLAETLEEAKIRITEEIFFSNIYIEDFNVYTTKYIEYGEHQIEIPETSKEFERKSESSILKEIFETELYKKLNKEKKERKEKEEKEEKETEENYKKEKIEKEKKELQRLKTKYEM